MSAHTPDAQPPEEPAWKRNGRAGPFDWWIGCKFHGGKFLRPESCLSCRLAATLNVELRKRLERERELTEPPARARSNHERCTIASLLR